MILTVSETEVRCLKQYLQLIWTAPSGATIAWLKDPDGNMISEIQKAGG
jgi:hypothetical protein